MILLQCHSNGYKSEMLMRVRASCVGWEAAQINVGYFTADFF